MKNRVESIHTILDAIEWMENTLSDFHGRDIAVTDEILRNVESSAQYTRDCVNVYLSWRSDKIESIGFKVKLIESYLNVWSGE